MLLIGFTLTFVVLLYILLRIESTNFGIVWWDELVWSCFSTPLLFITMLSQYGVVMADKYIIVASVLALLGFLHWFMYLPQRPAVDS